MTTVFISHSASDRPLAERVAAEMRAAGINSLFLDVDPGQGIPVGTNWREKLFTALRQADAVVAVMSTASTASMWCTLEIGTALTMRRPVFPVRGEPGVVNELVADLHWTDLGDPTWPKQLTRGLVDAGLDPSKSFAWNRSRRPYPGLRPFQPEDAGIFFGRDDDVRAVIAKLTPEFAGPAGSVVAVTGPSGCGKSSLVAAGLIPRLERARDPWIVLPVVRPEDAPLVRFGEALRSAFTARGVEYDLEEVRRLPDEPELIVGLLDRLAGQDPTGRRPAVLLVVDQAEELVTRVPPDHRRRFRELVAHIGWAPGPVSVVMTVRPEFLTGTRERPGLSDMIDEIVPIKPISNDRLSEVITRPAELAGMTFAPRLVGRMIADTVGGDALPLLAYTLDSLYENSRDTDRVVSEQSYDAIGGVLGALERAADTVVATLSREPVGRVTAKADTIDVLLRFAQIDRDAAATSRPVPRSDFDDGDSPVLEALIDARLLITEQLGTIPGSAAGRDDASAGVTTTVLRIAHEALLRQWPPLDEAVARLEDDLRLRSEIARLAGDWEGNARAESSLLDGPRLDAARELAGRTADRPADRSVQSVRLSSAEREFVGTSAQMADRRARRRSRLNIAIALAAVIAVALVTFAGTQYVAARREGADAASRALAADAADQNAGNPSYAAMLALAAHEQSPTAEAEQALFSQYVQDQNLGQVFSGAPGNIRAAHLSRDGSVVAAITSSGVVVVWTRPPHGPLERRQTTPDAEAEQMGMSPDGRTVWLKRQAGLTRYDVATGTMRVVAPLAPEDVNDSDVEVSGDGSAVAAVVGTTKTSRLRVWDTTTGAVIGELPDPSDLSILTYQFARGRTLLIQGFAHGATPDTAVGSPKDVERWTPQTGPPTVLATGLVESAVAPGSDVMALCGTDTGPNGLSELATARVSDGAPLHRRDVLSCGNGVATDDDGRIVVALSTDSSAADNSVVTDMVSGASTTFTSPVRTPEGGTLDDQPHIEPALLPGPHGPRIAAFTKSEVALGTLFVPNTGLDGVQSAILLPDDHTLATVADNGRTLALAQQDNAVIATAPRPAPAYPGGPQELTADSSGNLLADRDAANHVTVRRLPDLRPLSGITTPPVAGDPTTPGSAGLYSMFFDNGRLVTAVGPDVTVWNPSSGQLLAHLDLMALGQAKPGQDINVRPGPDPTSLAVVVVDEPDIRVVNVDTGRQVDTIHVGGDLLAGGFDPSGRYVYILRRAAAIELWNAHDQRRLIGPISTAPTGPNPEQQNLAATFINDSGNFFIGSGSRIRVYNVDSPTPIRELDISGGEQIIDSTSVDGQAIITRPSLVGSGYTLSLLPDDWRKDVCAVIGDRSLTPAERDALPAPMPDEQPCADA